MKRNRTRVVVALATLFGALVIVPAGAARADHVTGTGLNCWGAIAGQPDGVNAGDASVFIVKCFASEPMPTGLANMIAAECSTAFAAEFHATGTGGGAVGGVSSNWCVSTSTLTSHGVGFAYGDLVHAGGTIDGNAEGYPRNSFTITWSFTACPGSSCGSATFDWDGTSMFRPYATGVDASWAASTVNGRYWSPGLADEPCGADAECDTFYEGFPHAFVGGDDWPEPLCESYGVTWSPDDETTLGVGERQRVTLTAPHAQWDEVTLLYAWTWGYDPLNGWDPTTVPASYQVPVIESQTATTITLATKPASSATENREFHIRCDPDDPLQDNTFYRRAYGDLSTSDGPSRRACYFLRFTVDGPASDDWDDERAGRVWVEEDPRYDASGGITGLAYGWRPTGGTRVEEAMTLFDNDDLPWIESPAEGLFTVDATGLTGGTDGTQYVKCTDAGGSLWLVAGFAPAVIGGDTGGSGDGTVEGGTGGVGGEGTPPGGSTPGGDPGPGDVDGVGAGAIGDGPGNGASCFDNVGWSLTNPGSWVTGGIKVGACYVRALVWPDTEEIKAEYELLLLSVENNAPFSWFYQGLTMVTAFADSLPGAVTAHAGDCWTYAAAGHGGEHFSSVPALELCPAAAMSGAGWDVFRPWAGRFVWITWAIGCMMAAGRLWGMGGTETWYLANEFNPGGV